MRYCHRAQQARGIDLQPRVAAVLRRGAAPQRGHGCRQRRSRGFPALRSSPQQCCQSDQRVLLRGQRGAEVGVGASATGAELFTGCALAKAVNDVQPVQCLLRCTQR